MLNKEEIIKKLLEWRESTLEDIMKNTIFSSENNIMLDAIAYDKGYVNAIETVLFWIYGYEIKK